ncbi:MAG: bifunctional metallophosphatase/5'-nucleotidase [Spirochaetaceae bacterium]|nr:bifunctional metallophosphatase/5'-nucleotidase [Spirochaetaceae bacterium]
MKRKFIFYLLVFCLSFYGCVSTNITPSDSLLSLEKDIVILYENDVHCNVDGYAKVSVLKNELIQENNYVAVVSSGDYIQGSSLGAISQGEYIANLINLVDYDVLTLGNHEFDYKLSRLYELTSIIESPIVCSNFINLKENELVFEPYKIISYEDFDIAFIGVTTPSTISSSSPIQFMDDNGNYLYSFSGDNLYKTVQNNINEAKKDGAEFIILLSHLGTEGVLPQWSCQELVKNTYGIDVVLDGHSHSVIEKEIIKDKKNREVIISSTGTKFQNIGKLTLTNTGEVKTELISTDIYNSKDLEIENYIKQINDEYKKLGERFIGENKINLITHNSENIRIIRNTETNLGDFCADAFRIVTNSDVGVINGGGIRAPLNSGKITFNDILNVFPWNNTVCVAEVSGQQLLDFLEFVYMSLPEENGSFQQVSGIQCVVNTKIPTSVVVDENDVFVKVTGARRVSDVKILNKENNQYEEIDKNKLYTLASHNYLLLDKGSGASMLNNSKIIANDGMLDVELLEKYIKENLNGTITEEYLNEQKRILIK